MENRDPRRRDSHHSPSPPQQHPPPRATDESNNHRASQLARPRVTDGDDGHRPSPPAPFPPIRDPVPYAELERRGEQQQRRLRTEAPGASTAAAAAPVLHGASVPLFIASAVTSGAISSAADNSQPTLTASSRRRHRSGEPASARSGVGDELDPEDSLRSPSFSPPSRRLQRELSLQPAVGDRNSMPRVSSLTLSNQQWLGPSVQNSGRVSASGQPVASTATSSSSLGQPPVSAAAAAAASAAVDQASLLAANSVGPSVTPMSSRSTGQSGLVGSQMTGRGGGGGGAGGGDDRGRGEGEGRGRAGARVQSGGYPDSSPEPKVSPLGTNQPQWTNPSTFPEISGEIATIANVTSLNDRIAALWDQPDLADVTLRVGGTRYPAHRLILASGSEVFRVMLLSSSWQDSRQPEIELEERSECLPYFGDFLKYFYTSTMIMTTEKAIPILFLADKYAVEDLRDSVIRFMINNIAQQSDTNRTISWYQYAKNCGHIELKNRCCEFIVWNMRVVIKSPDWINVDLENLIEFLDYSDMVITDEFTLLKALEIWVRTNSCEDSYLDDDGRQVASLAADAASTVPVAADDDAAAVTEADSTGAASASTTAAALDHVAPEASNLLNADDISPPEPPQQVLQQQQQQQLRDLAASPLPSARALLERVLPHVRFPMIKPEQLALLEEDAFKRKYFSSFESYMVNAYKYHAVQREHRKGAAFLFGNNSTHFRNYTNRNMSIHMQFDNYSQRSRSNFTWQFTTLASASNADVSNKIKWEINFRPKGYSDYYNNNESTRFTLETHNKEISLETDIAVFVLTRHQDTNFVNLVTKSTFFFGGDSKVFKIENLLNLGELLKKECPMIIDDTLNLIVFVKAKSLPS